MYGTLAFQRHRPDLVRIGKVDAAGAIVMCLRRSRHWSGVIDIRGGQRSVPSGIQPVNCSAKKNEHKGARTGVIGKSILQEALIVDDDIVYKRFAGSQPPSDKSVKAASGCGPDKSTCGRLSGGSKYSSGFTGSSSVRIPV